MTEVEYKESTLLPLRSGLRAFALAVLLILTTGVSHADPVRVAVAANFLSPVEVIASAFEAAGGEPVEIVSGATGQHYAQIINGAPFDVFLAADQARPARLLEQGLAIEGSVFTYALGRLVLWAGDGHQLPDNGFAGLVDHPVTRLAIANPRLAPYGRAARDALQATGQWQALQPRLVEGLSVGRALHYLATGNVSHALVAASYTHARGRPGGAWVAVDPSWHEPIRQDAVRLVNASNPAGARAFMTFLKSAEAQTILQGFGYRAAGEVTEP
ncbi:molybdate ABC transporter substrate-binding protein [Spiribacter sp. 218]|uniref:molybdate ABC transporter substrate-binding protein n=1 Tax=Spiribacter pallidus TaxID=1987936 RepID=UPI00349FC3DC